MRDPVLTRRAKEMRKDMPEPEMRLWLELRAARFQGIKFRRQKVIGKFIADFASNNPKLVIELDGDTHAMQASYDEKRTQFLESQGYKVIRFSNSEIMGNMDGVLMKRAKLVVGMGFSPPPTPSPEGEGALL